MRNMKFIVNVVLAVSSIVALGQESARTVQYHSQDIVARLWLIEGVPVDDVVTMLVVRRRFEIPIALCSARAREIAQTAQRMIARRKIA